MEGTREHNVDLSASKHLPASNYESLVEISTVQRLHNTTLKFNLIMTAPSHNRRREIFRQIKEAEPTGQPDRLNM